MEDLVCPQCGHPNPADANFCSVCGTVLVPEGDESRTATHLALEVPEDDGAMLVVVRGANAGSRYSIGGAVTTIGRHPDSDVFLDDVTVSRRHSEIRRSSTGYEIADTGSLNGTYVNGERVESSVLREADQLQVGKFKLVVVGGGGGDA